MMESIQDELIRGVVEEMDNIIIEGLKLKGFEFDNKYELGLFVKENCTVSDDVYMKERVFSVCNKPFLIHYYKVDDFVSPICEGHTAKMVLDYGKYQFIK